MNIGFIGLGIMGTPMAANLVRAGHTVVGYDVSTARLDELAELGGKAAASLGEAVAQAHVVITMLPDSPQVEEVVFGEDGVLDHAPAGLLLIDMSTIRPETSRRVAQAAAVKGVHAIDAPVSGGEKGAIDGTLSIMIGGRTEDVESAREILRVLGTTIVHVGPAGAGQTVKAANQLVVGGTYALIAEAIVLLEASGVDPKGASTCSPGGWPGRGSWSSSATPWSSATSSRASASTCTTRTWASPPPPPARPGSRSP